MAAYAHGPSVVQDHDLIRVLYGADTLGHDKLCGFVEFILQSLSQSGVCLIVQGRERVVKNQDLRFPRQSPGNGYSLLLTAGKIPSAGFDLLVQLSGHTFHKFSGLGDIQRFPCVLL